jgi:hypothetical protein
LFLLSIINCVPHFDHLPTQALFTSTEFNPPRSNYRHYPNYPRDIFLPLQSEQLTPHTQLRLMDCGSELSLGLMTIYLKCDQSEADGG